MAVKVVIRRRGSSAEVADPYPTANEFYVKDGHLHVVKNRGGNLVPVAAYAPGNWLFAAVTEQE